LLHDKESLATVMEVVELGISGSKSQSRASDPPIFKEDKSPLPASRRVRDAAEGLLNLILEEVSCSGRLGSEVFFKRFSAACRDEPAYVGICRVLF
jgi:hypothetical protein